MSWCRHKPNPSCDTLLWIRHELLSISWQTYDVFPLRTIRNNAVRNRGVDMCFLWFWEDT